MLLCSGLEDPSQSDQDPRKSGAGPYSEHSRKERCSSPLHSQPSSFILSCGTFELPFLAFLFILTSPLPKALTSAFTPVPWEMSRGPQYKDGRRTGNRKGRAASAPDLILFFTSSPGHFLLSNYVVPRFLLLTELGRFAPKSVGET